MKIFGKNFYLVNNGVEWDFWFLKHIKIPSLDNFIIQLFFCKNDFEVEFYEDFCKIKIVTGSWCENISQDAHSV